MGSTTALRLSGVVSVLAAAGAPTLARPVLAIFGPGYEQARYCLIALAICTFPFAVKSIYIPVRRAQGALGKAALAVSLGAALELGAVELGLKLGGVTGVGIALGAAMVVEAAIFLADHPSGASLVGSAGHRRGAQSPRPGIRDGD